MAWFYLAAITAMLGATWVVVTAIGADSGYRRAQAAHTAMWLRERDEGLTALSPAPEPVQAEIHSSAVIIGEVVE